VDAVIPATCITGEACGSGATDPECCAPDATSGLDTSRLVAPLTVQIEEAGTVTGTIECRLADLTFASLGTIDSNTPVVIDSPQHACYYNASCTADCAGTKLKICGQPIFR